jgi:hypothetical protein
MKVDVRLTEEEKSLSRDSGLAGLQRFHKRPSTGIS